MASAHIPEILSLPPSQGPHPDTTAIMADTTCLPQGQGLNTETRLQTKLEAIFAAFWLKLENR
ncbi:Hypothetical predicted protein, partial [Pelobates cultripes]